VTMSGVHIAREVVDQSSSETSFAIVKQWLDDCVEKHTKCSPTAGRLPARVLDVVSNKVKLVETQQKSAPYLTLSHCWGNKKIITTTKATLKSRKSDIPWLSLSRTFQDAITITRELGFRYLWIDSLCIIQDDKKDWERESAKMASIYADSWLTIAAALGIDGDSGCFSSRLGNPFEAELTVEDNMKKPKPAKIIDPALRHPYRVTGLTSQGTEFEVFVRLALEHRRMSLEWR
jgi:hypothetical protein